jgi:uncharacterized C2H2 Zn-finger protein
MQTDNAAAVPRQLIRALRRLLQERQNQARREHKLLSDLVRTLPALATSRMSRQPALKTATKARRKRLRCPRCDRTFAMPMHLGRHIAMSHKKRRAA